VTLSLSIVIPTYNRLDALKKVLESLRTQSLAHDRFEVILVDDGSTDGTGDWITRADFPFAFTYRKQANAGPARARNVGIHLAGAPRIAFFGDDTTLERDCLSIHAGEFEPVEGLAVLGFTDWPRDMNVTPFMDYINRFGLQFGYDIIPDPENVPFNFFYTSNVSLPSQPIRNANGFDESFPFAAWEDIECAYRMMQSGLKMVYRPKAVCRHHHPTTMKSFTVRQYKSGIAAATMAERHPELADFVGLPLARVTGQKRPVRLRIQERICRLLERQGWFRPNRWYRAIMENHYLRGLSAALQSRDGKG